MERRYTVVEICRAMQREPDDRLMWEAGAAVRDRWQALGHDMEYDLREKKNGGGSHQFAVYPEWFRAEVEAIIASMSFELARQTDLFGGGWVPGPPH